MSTMKIVYRLGPEAQKAALLAGRDGRQLQVAVVPATPELLQLATIRPDGTAWIYGTTALSREELTRVELQADPHTRDTWWPVPCARIWYEVEVYNNRVTAEKQNRAYSGWHSRELLDSLPEDLTAWALSIPAENQARYAKAEADLADHAAKRERERQESINNTRRRFKEWIEKPHNNYYRSGTGTKTFTVSCGQFSIFDLTDEDQALYDQICDTLDGEKARKEHEKKERELAAKRARDQERDRWIAEHGSARLQAALDLGLIEQSWGIYRDERRCLELPDWQWDSDEWEDSEIRNPSEKALVRLAMAREIDEHAELIKQRQKLDESERGDYCPEDSEEQPWIETIRLSVPWAKRQLVWRLD